MSNMNFARYILGFLILVAGAAHAADRSLQLQDAVVTLQDKACQVGVILAAVAPEVRKALKHGTVVVTEGKNKTALQLCWIEDNGLVFMMDENGYSPVIPSSAFEAPLPPKNSKI